VKLPKVETVRLDNGFRAFLLERHNLPIVATVLWYEVGARDELSGETGLSHFLEHMMFKGSSKYAKGEIDLLTSKLGGSNNAFTDCDATAYHFTLAADRWETALEIEADRMQTCILDAEEFAAEKQVVLEELAMGEDDPWRRLFEAIETLSYQVHPYHHPVIGWKQDLERLSANRMRSYYERNYGPNRAFLVAAGDFDSKAARSRIQELFGDLREVEARQPVLAEPNSRVERRMQIEDPGSLTRICLACRTCRMGEREDFVLDLISTVLGSGRSSRLHDRLVTKENLASSVTVWNEVRLDPGLFWVAAELVGDADPQKVEDIIREELFALARKGPSAAELKRARMQILANYLHESETVLDSALRIARFEGLAQGGHELLNNAIEIYAGVSSAEIKSLAKRFFVEGSWNIVWSIPEAEAGKGRS
jgi:zinc protease